MCPRGEIGRHKGLNNYCYFFFYTHVLFTIGNTRVFKKPTYAPVLQSRIQSYMDCRRRIHVHRITEEMFTLCPTL